MAFQDMLNDFQLILNRDDCSTAQATTFLTQGMQRIQRECRLPNMEKSTIITPTAGLQWFTVPLDLIQPIDCLVTGYDGLYYPLKHTSYRRLVRVDPNDDPKVYARQQSQIWIAGTVQAGATIQFLYYGNFSPFASTTSDNELSASIPDLGVYAALRFAGDHFEHPSVDRWENTYQQIKAQAQQMAIDLEMQGGPMAVEPLYSCDWD